jgi:O-antigen ligase
LDRFRTLFANENTVVTAEMKSAEESKDARLDLLIESLKITATHPVFGVGPGMFQVATGWRWQDGIGMGWRQTHNTYTELSSETGIPGLLLYMAAFLWCLRTLLAIRRATRNRPDLKEVDDMAFCFLLALFIFAVSGFFSSMAYHTHFPMLAAMITALHFTVRPVISVPMALAPRPVAPRPAFARA